MFGFVFEMPEDWRFYGKRDFIDGDNACEYAFFMAYQDGRERTSEWDNSVSLRVKADGNVSNQQQAKDHLLHSMETKEIEMIQEGEEDNFLGYKVFANGKLYNYLIYFKYTNGLCYSFHWSYESDYEPPSNLNFHEMLDTLKMVPQEISYEDLDEEIYANRGNPTFLLNKAHRQFAFHQFEDAIETCTEAIGLAEFFGEAFLLRANCNFNLDDKQAACMDYYSALEHEAIREGEIPEYCID